MRPSVDGLPSAHSPGSRGVARPRAVRLPGIRAPLVTSSASGGRWVPTCAGTTPEGNRWMPASAGMTTGVGARMPGGVIDNRFDICADLRYNGRWLVLLQTIGHRLTVLMESDVV